MRPSTGCASTMAWASWGTTAATATTKVRSNSSSSGVEARCDSCGSRACVGTIEAGGGSAGEEDGAERQGGGECLDEQDPARHGESAVDPGDDDAAEEEGPEPERGLGREQEARE